MIGTERILKAASDWQIRKNTRSTMRLDGFLEGAKWMQYALTQELWHHAAEEPKRNMLLLTQNASGYRFLRYEEGCTEPWNTYCYDTGLKRWCYLGDILPDEEHGQ